MQRGRPQALGRTVGGSWQRVRSRSGGMSEVLVQQPHGAGFSVWAGKVSAAMR